MNKDGIRQNKQRQRMVIFSFGLLILLYAASKNPNLLVNGRVCTKLNLVFKYQNLHPNVGQTEGSICMLSQCT